MKWKTQQQKKIKSQIEMKNLKKILNLNFIKKSNENLLIFLWEFSFKQNIYIKSNERKKRPKLEKLRLCHPISVVDVFVLVVVNQVSHVI